MTKKIDMGLQVIGLDELNEKIKQLNESVAETNRLANEIASATLEITSKLISSD